MNFYDLPSTNPWWNMAFDEWLLQNGPDEPVFRLWRNEPSVIIGHNQVAAQEVNLEYLRQNGIKLARRVTGGGAVYHDLQNLNYSFAGPLRNNSFASIQPVNRQKTPKMKVSPCFSGGIPSKSAENDGCPSSVPRESLENPPAGAALFAEALQSLGLPAELTGRNDIFVAGRKISGYARSVWHNRELVHGTLMYDVDIDTLTAALNVEGSSKLNLKGVGSVRSRVTNVRELLPQFASLDEVQAALQDYLSAGGSAQKNGGKLSLSPAEKASVDSMAATKFATPEWIYR